MTPEPKQQVTQQLLSIISSQIEQVSSYLELMDEIKRCVVENDVTALNSLVAQNNQQPDDIEKMRQQQYELLQSCGYAANESGLRGFIEDSGSERLDEVSQKLSAQIKQLEKSLLVNGLLVNKNQRRVRQSIQILCGHDHSNAPPTYSRQGNLSENENCTRKLAQA